MQNLFWSSSFSFSNIVDKNNYLTYRFSIKVIDFAVQIRRQTQLSRHIGHTLVTFVLGKVWIYKAVGWGHGDFRWRQSPSHPPIGWGQIWISSRNENCQKQIERDRLYLMSRYWRCQKSMLMFPQLIVYQKKFADPLF